MSTSSFPNSVTVQEGVISSTLNGSLLFNFLIGAFHTCHFINIVNLCTSGVYTMVYIQTMYRYLHKQIANINRRIVLAAISTLYLLALSNPVLQWYLLNLQIVLNGGTRESIFIVTLEGGPRGLLALNAFLFYSSFIVSDGLLYHRPLCCSDRPKLWRCYHVWGQSLRVILFPTILVFAEFGEFYNSSLFVAVTVLVARFGDFEVNTTLFENIETALVFVSLGTTVTTTSLIAHRINAASLLNGSSSNRLFTRAVTLVIESAAAYSLVLLIYAVFTIVPRFIAFGSPVDNAVFYLQVLVSTVAGMAPTVLVARIALTSPHITTGQTIANITGLRFESQPRSNRSGTETGEVRPSMLTGEAAVAMVCEAKNNSSGHEVESV
ncbi:hypothetical protein CVT25_006146 [Psilocybe cyanescens]|uniref:G-protein coupled receptors family 1 profile domain-containing protein n=1 Tax=Psilocybe cyanescens TaxID=93625 RepID=A0A409WYY0_PSICY|nr:hypothetical protein CVT25_006146 [Psilocybe cyanescens]